MALIVDGEGVCRVVCEPSTDITSSDTDHTGRVAPRHTFTARARRPTRLRHAYLLDADVVKDHLETLLTGVPVLPFSMLVAQRTARLREDWQAREKTLMPFSSQVAMV